MSLVIFDKPFSDRTDSLSKAMAEGQLLCSHGIPKSRCFAFHEPVLTLVRDDEEEG